MDPLIEKRIQTLKSSFGNILSPSKRKSKGNETYDGREIVKKTCTDFKNDNKNRRRSRYTSKGIVFAERFLKMTSIYLKSLFLKKIMLI